MNAAEYYAAMKKNDATNICSDMNDSTNQAQKAKHQTTSLIRE